MLDTTYFFAASIVRAEGFHPGFHPIRLGSVRAGRHRGLHHFVSHPAKEEGIGLGDVLACVTMQVFVHDTVHDDRSTRPM